MGPWPAFDEQKINNLKNIENNNDAVFIDMCRKISDFFNNENIIAGIIMFVTYKLLFNSVSSLCSGSKQFSIQELQILKLTHVIKVLVSQLPNSPRQR